MLNDLSNKKLKEEFKNINNQLKNHKYKFRRTPVSGSIFLMPTNKEEIIKIVGSLKYSHVAGYDGLSLDTLKKCVHKTSSPSSTVINSHMEDESGTSWYAKIVISKGQYGFVKGSFTITAASNFIEGVTGEMDNKEHVCGIYLDLQKAFDCAETTILQDKLWNDGIGGTEHNLKRSYLTNRKQLVSISTTEEAYKSNISDVYFGIPQG
ncbi:uncharacterized protein LOC126267890 [Schistocerca gregaria]|uniref:uncharacterized protein LOC126267890 n=1 Tax=Schistocerca gregaria TaxID=7010 RepID=UPI00211ECFFA|nr:uncharacterized protein LOC126267890 [Schistocerca gregaria]